MSAPDALPKKWLQSAFAIYCIRFILYSHPLANDSFFIPTPSQNHSFHPLANRDNSFFHPFEKMAAVVRSSKFRHVFGKTVRKEDQYENVQVPFCNLPPSTTSVPAYPPTR